MALYSLTQSSLSHFLLVVPKDGMLPTVRKRVLCFWLCPCCTKCGARCREYVSVNVELI